MNDQPNLRELVDEVSSFTGEADPPAAVEPRREARSVGSSSKSPAPDRRPGWMPPAARRLQSHSDPSVAMSGQVGSQVKMVVGADG